MRLLIVRHGRTDHNEIGLMQGLNVGQLNDTGVQQVNVLTTRLAKEGVTRFYASDADRTRTTAELINQQLKLELHYSPLLREKDNGDFQGMDPKKIDWSIVGDDFENGRPPNGESLSMVRSRAIKFLEEEVEPVKETNETILVVSHGGFIKVLVGYLLGMDLRHSVFNLRIENASLTEIVYNKKFQLKTWGEVVFNENPTTKAP